MKTILQLIIVIWGFVQFLSPNVKPVNSLFELICCAPLSEFCYFQIKPKVRDDEIGGHSYCWVETYKNERRGRKMKIFSSGFTWMGEVPVQESLSPKIERRKKWKKEFSGLSFYWG